MAAARNNRSNSNATDRLVRYLQSTPSIRDIDYDRVFRMIRQEGADPSAVSGMLFDYIPGMGMQEHTLLMGAVMGRNVNVRLIKDLIGADAFDQSKRIPRNGDTILHVLLDALEEGDPQARKEVLEIFHAEDPSLITEENQLGIRPLDVAIQRFRRDPENGRILCRAILDILHEEKADLDGFQSVNDPYLGGSKSYLMVAAEEGCTFVAERLLELGANPNLQNKSGKTALMIAVEQGYDDISEILLQHDADLDLQDKEGKTALMLAAELGMYHDLDMLLGHGARQNLSNSRNRVARNMTRSRRIKNRLNRKNGGARKTRVRRGRRRN